MGYGLPTPDYGLLKNLPQPDPVGSALGAYQTVKATRRADQAAALKAQESQLAIHSAKRAIHDTRLADIHEMPAGQKGPAYQKYLHEMGTLGGDTSKMPPKYGPEVENEAGIAYAKSPMGTGDRKYARDVAMQQLKNAGLLQAAAAKQRLKMQAPAKQSALQVAQSKQLVKDSATINFAATEAQTKAIPLWTEINQQLDKVMTGPGIGKIDIRSGPAQRLNQLLLQAQGMKIKEFHLGRMTQYEFNLIRKMVGTPSMYKSVLRQIVRKHMRDAKEAIEQQKFSSAYAKGGGISPTEMSSQWVKEVGKRRQADIEFTAKQNKMTVAQVREQLGYNL